MKSIRLREGRERSLLRRHPWVFEGSIESGKARRRRDGAHRRERRSLLAWAFYSPTSTIRARVWSFDEAERIDAAFFERRLARALARANGL